MDEMPPLFDHLYNYSIALLMGVYTLYHNTQTSTPTRFPNERRES